MRTRDDLLVLLTGWVNCLEVLVNHLGDDDLAAVYQEMADVWVEEEEASHDL